MLRLKLSVEKTKIVDLEKENGFDFVGRPSDLCHFASQVSLKFIAFHQKRQWIMFLLNLKQSFQAMQLNIGPSPMGNG